MKTLHLTLVVAALALAAPLASAAPAPQVCAATPAGYVDVFGTCDPGFTVYVACIYSDVFLRVICADHSYDANNGAHCRGIYVADEYTVHCNGDSSCPYYEDTRFLTVNDHKCNSDDSKTFAQLP